jgi:hypothetical protein
MGSGLWSASVYDAAAARRAATGTPAFAYSAHTFTSTPRGAWAAHPRLDPSGVRWRESRDSDEHPTSRAVTVLFDVTGSMHTIPQRLQEKLPELLGLLLRKGYLAHPQIMFGAIGDATCDAVPLQIGQWESDNRLDEDLERIFLEGGGGGQATESYELALYFMARHTAIDCYEKRGEKGFLFLIGDEMAYPRVKRDEVQRIVGDGLQEDIPVARIVAEVRERFHLYYLLPTTAHHGGDPQIRDFWRGLLGQHVIELDDPDAVCETIALLIGLHEGVDLAAGVDDLRDFGVDGSTVHSVSTALAPVAASAAVNGRGAIVRPKGGALAEFGEPDLASSGGRRL